MNDHAEPENAVLQPADQPTNAAIEPPADSGLRCPACEYNLTGVAEDRCPECGKTFNRQYVEAVAAGAPGMIPIWDDGYKDVALRFMAVCLLTWFAPGRFGRMFPSRCYEASVTRFRATVSVVTVLGYLGCLVPVVGFPALLAVGLATAPVLIGVALCERMLDAGLVLHAPEPGARPWRPDVCEAWQGLVPFFRSFLLLQAAALGTAGLLAAVPGWSAPPALLFLGILGIPLWWWLALAIAVAARARAGKTRINGLIVVAAIGLLWLVVAQMFVAVMFAL